MQGRLSPRPPHVSGPYLQVQPGWSGICKNGGWEENVKLVIVIPIVYIDLVHSTHTQACRLSNNQCPRVYVHLVAQSKGELRGLS